MRAEAVQAREAPQGAELSLVRRAAGMSGAALSGAALSGAALSGAALPGAALPGEAVLSDEAVLPVLPALQGLLPGGALRRGSVVAAGPWSLLCLALAAGASAAGAWCAVVGLPQLGVAAAAGAGLGPNRMLMIADPGTGWPQVVASLLDGCELVLLRSPDRPPAQVRRRIEATVRRFGGVLVVAGGGRRAAPPLHRPAGMDRDRNRPRAAACSPGPGGRRWQGRGGAAADPVAVASRTRRVGDRCGPDQSRSRPVLAGN